MKHRAFLVRTQQTSVIINPKVSEYKQFGEKRSKGQFYRISGIIISLAVDLESYDFKEYASKTRKQLIQACDLHESRRTKGIFTSGIYSATVLEVDIWLFNIMGLFLGGLVNRTL